MSLTGTPLLVLVWAAAAASFVAVVAGWRSASGGRPADVLRRVVMLGTVNVLLLVAIGAAANRTFDFFSDWTDLRGALGVAVPATSVAQGAVPAQAEGVRLPFPAPVAPLPAHAAAPKGLRADRGRDGQVLRYLVRGASTGITAPVRVWLPPGYAAAVAAGRRLPVVEAFPGYPGSTLEWFHSMALPAIYRRQVAAHRVREAVVVSPSVEIPAGYDTECVDGGPAGPQVEGFLTRDVPTWVRQHFAVVPDRTSWTALGLSAGGWCAAMAALRHPDEYGAAVVLGGYFRPDFSLGYRPFSPASTPGRGYDLVRLERDRRPPVAIWLQTSHSDRLSYPSSAEFLRAVRPPTSVRATVLAHAGHRLSVWRALLGPALDWVGATVPGFAPAPTPVAALRR